MTQKTKVLVTRMEEQVFDALVSLMYAERGFSDADISDITSKTGIPAKQLRGVISSLIKKDLVVAGGEDFEGILYLADRCEGFVPDWLDEGAAEPTIELAVNDVITIHDFNKWNQMEDKGIPSECVELAYRTGYINVFKYNYVLLNFLRGAKIRHSVKAR